MARTREFDEADVLDRAMALFHARGFAHTSFADLVEALGVSRQSLYDTYGDKHALFQTALRRYMERAVAGVQRRLERPAPIREVLADLFAALISGACDGDASGCFMVNSMVELTPHDADARTLAHAYARKIESLLASRLSAAQRKGELSRAKDPVMLARFFFQTILGIGVAARAFGEPDNLQRSTRLALQLLD
ncbi:MAG TPA: TetR/AcrR family transcriptional regulator [Opitutus sp.]|nr:TetR/AcrR family transcriptional regulator [Opitutus sp.]